MIMQDRVGLVRRRCLQAGWGLLAAAWAGSSRARCDAEVNDLVSMPRLSGRVLQVRPGDPAASLAAVSRMARDGDTVDIEAGDYRGDVAVWPQNDLLLHATGGRARLWADGRSAEDKAIFVIRGQRVRVERLEFRGARVRDRNGAGIRQESGPLSIHDCAFIDNENGILSGNLPTIELFLTDSTFLENGNAEGSAHNLYVGDAGRLAAEGCWFGRSRVGHLLKSRARDNSIRYCRLTGEDGTGSYELEFPSGGRAVVLGNLIQQGPRSENQAIVSYGAEGYRWPNSSLLMAFNTIVNDRVRGSTFVRVSAGAQAVTLAHNITIGKGELTIDAPLNSMGNVELSKSDFGDPATFDYRLRPASRAVGRVGFRGSLDAKLPGPTREYMHEASSCPLDGLSPLTPLSPGAFQRLAG